MRPGVLFLFLPAFLLHFTDLSAQLVISNKSVTSVCYGSGRVNRVYIPPPKGILESKGNKGANIKVYYSGFTSSPKAAFKYAVSILSSFLPEDVNITLRATWGPLAEETVLGSTSITSYIGGAFINALDPYVYYPVSVAEKIAGTTLNSDEEGDLSMSINSRVTWYTGTDGNTPNGMYDLVTVVLHELIHGLGFVDSFNAQNSIGSYGLNSIPLIYDTFIESQDGYRLTDTKYFLNNSSALYSQLTGAGLYFGGPLLRTANSGPRVRIYAPSAWDNGSSISHLNESTTPQVNALMTPFIDMGEAIHNPGTYALSILGDIGWINTRIIHDKFNDIDQVITELEFEAVVKSDTTFNRDFVGLVYSFNNGPNDTLFMVPQLQTDTFRISLPIPAYNTSVGYYIFVQDRFDRIYRLPSTGLASPYKIFIGKDTIKPVINHTSVDFLFDRTKYVKLNAVVTDNIGVDTVYAEYRKNEGSSYFEGFVLDSLSDFSSSLDLKLLELAPGDSLQYRLIAIDTSSSKNMAIFPASGFFTVKFEATLPVSDSYVTDFTDASSDFMNRGFSVTKPAQFPDPGLHTLHPYESPEEDGASIEYSSILKRPLTVDVTGIIISFREIVLVEPGETGSVYGSPDFYDYVVVEASKDFGGTWFPMADGYDSRTSSVFLNAFNSLMDGNNSTYVGNPDIYQKRTIDIRTFDKFNKGDTLMIRFRLYSDPYAYGWGWAIDDLNIKSVAADVPELILPDFRIYPNPGSGLISVDPGEPYGKEINYRIVNMAGNIVSSGRITADKASLIDISTQPPGIYLVIIETGASFRTVRYTKVR